MKLSSRWMAGSTAWAWDGAQWLAGIVENVGRVNIAVYTHDDQTLRRYPADHVRLRSTHQRGNDRPVASPTVKERARRIKVTA